MKSRHIQAEFAGFDFDEGISDTVRSVTVGFKELPDNGDFSSVDDSDRSIGASNEWDSGGMHNAFAWIEDSLAYILRKRMKQPGEQKESMTWKYRF